MHVGNAKSCYNILTEKWFSLCLQNLFIYLFITLTWIFCETAQNPWHGPCTHPNINLQHWLQWHKLTQSSGKVWTLEWTWTLEYFKEMLLKYILSSEMHQMSCFTLVIQNDKVDWLPTSNLIFLSACTEMERWHLGSHSLKIDDFKLRSVLGVDRKVTVEEDKDFLFLPKQMNCTLECKSWMLAVLQNYFKIDWNKYSLKLFWQRDSKTFQSIQTVWENIANTAMSQLLKVAASKF